MSHASRFVKGGVQTSSDGLRFETRSEQHNVPSESRSIDERKLATRAATGSGNALNSSFGAGAAPGGSADAAGAGGAAVAQGFSADDMVYLNEIDRRQKSERLRAAHTEAEADREFAQAVAARASKAAHDPAAILDQAFNIAPLSKRKREPAAASASPSGALTATGADAIKRPRPATDTPAVAAPDTSHPTPASTAPPAANAFAAYGSDSDDSSDES